MTFRVFISALGLVLFGAHGAFAAERVQLLEISYGTENRKYTSDLLEEPKGCLAFEVENSKPCSFRVGHGRKLLLKAEGRILTIGDNTIVIREAADRYRLVEGFLRVEADASSETPRTTKTVLLVSSASNWRQAARVQGEGEFFVERYNNTVSVVNTGSRKVWLFSGGRDEGSIGTGMEVRFTKPDRRSGKYEVGAPLPLNLEAQVVREAKLYAGEKAKFGERVDQLLTIQRGAAELAAKIHRDSVARKLASLEAEAEKRRSDAARQEAEDREIRAMFRRKVLSVE